MNSESKGLRTRGLEWKFEVFKNLTETQSSIVHYTKRWTVKKLKLIKQRKTKALIQFHLNTMQTIKADYQS